MILRKGLEAAAKEVIERLDGMREDIAANKKRIAEVATISAGDAKIGALIAEVMEKVGREGVVTVEEGQGLDLESEVVEGFTFDRGFVSAYMVTDTARLEAIYDKPAVVVTDRKVSSVQEFLPILEKLAQTGKKDLVLIADDVDGEALATLILNRLKGVFNTVAVKAPSFGDRRKEILEDLAILTGATVISEDRGITFEDADLSMIGSARRIIVGKDETTIIEGAGPAAVLQARIQEISSQIEATTSEYDREQLEKRRAALSGKVAVIKVGGATETQIEEEKFRVDDAVAAVKAALAEGIVPGGGVTLVELAEALKAGKEDNDFGRVLLANALYQPFIQLMQNAGENGEAKLITLLTNKKSGEGIDVNNPHQTVNMKDKGIIDPVRVTKQAIQHAVSIAGTSMTMGALIVEVPAKEEPAAAGTPDMGGMGLGM